MLYTPEYVLTLEFASNLYAVFIYMYKSKLFNICSTKLDF